ncbi:MAG: hypothetical protein WCB18_03800 [Thermoplasmata archaeon]
MNRLLFLIGVALAIIGLVFSFVPLFNGPSGVLTPSKPDAAFNATTPFSLTGGWTIEVSWTSNHAVSLLVVVCRSINTSAPSLQKVCPGAALSVLNGTSGSSSFWVPLSGVLLIGIVSNATPGLRVDVQLKPTLTVIGTIFVLGGAGVALVGLLPRRKPALPAPASVADLPAGPSKQ